MDPSRSYTIPHLCQCRSAHALVHFQHCTRVHTSSTTCLYHVISLHNTLIHMHHPYSPYLQFHYNTCSFLTYLPFPFPLPATWCHVVPVVATCCHVVQVTAPCCHLVNPNTTSSHTLSITSPPTSLLWQSSGYTGPGL